MAETARGALPGALGSWVPTSTSAQMCAPDPGIYGDISMYKNVGGLVKARETAFGASKSKREPPKIGSGTDARYNYKIKFYFSCLKVALGRFCF